MTDYYINADTGNNGTGNGSSGNPWQTFVYALSQVSAGDAIICADATATYLFPTAVTTLPANLTVRGGTATGTVFDQGGGGLELMYSAGNLTFENLTLRNAVATQAKGLIANASTSLSVTGAFTNCIFHSLDLWTSGGAFGGVICGRQGAIGAINLSSCLFYNCKEVSGQSATFSSFRDGTMEFNLYNNTFYTSIAGAQAILTYFSSLNTVISGTWKNNIFANDSGESVTLSGLGTPPTYENNCAYLLSGVPSGSNNITSDPLFVNAAGGNFNLQGSSPCIGTGTVI
jgi:hypothetical protein